MYRVESIDDFLRKVPARLIATHPIITRPGSCLCGDAWEWMQPAAQDITTVIVRDGAELRYATRSTGWQGSRDPLARIAVDVPDEAQVPSDADLEQALEAVLEHGFCLVGVGPGQAIVTAADFQKPAGSLWAFGVILSFEDALTRLFPSLSHGKWKEKLSKGMRERLEREVSRRRKEPNALITEEHCLSLADKRTIGRRIVAPALSMSGQKWKDSTGCLPKMRNHLAHGRSLGAAYNGDVVAALGRLIAARDLAQRLWGLVDDRESLWQAMRDTVLDFDTARPDGRFWMISAQNPGEVRQPKETNEQRHQALCDRLRREGAFVGEVSGKSNEGPWEERMAIMAPGTDEEACAIARDFDKRAVFRVEDGDLVVVDTRMRAERGRRRLE